MVGLIPLLSTNEKVCLRYNSSVRLFSLVCSIRVLFTCQPLLQSTPLLVSSNLDPLLMPTSLDGFPSHFSINSLKVSSFVLSWVASDEKLSAREKGFFSFSQLSEMMVKEGTSEPAPTWSKYMCLYGILNKYDLI